MRKPITLLLTLLVLFAATASAALGDTAVTARHRASAGSKHTAARPAAAKAPVAARADTSANDAAHAGARTLEDIHIEGEIPVPQVLFISAREQRRFMEFQHHRYLKNSREVGAATVPPSRIVMTHANDAGKEPTR